MKDKNDVKKEYRKTLKPIRADLKKEERAKLDEILKEQNKSVIGWIRTKIDEDYKKID